MFDKRKQDVERIDKCRSQRALWYLFLVSFIIVWFSAPLLCASTYYVASSGDDTFACSSPEEPCATVSGAFSRVVSGDIIRISDGIYTVTELTIDRNVVIEGNSPTSCILQVATEPHSNLGRLFIISPGVTCDIRSVTMRNGSVPQGPNNNAGSHGGAIHNSGFIQITNCYLLNNSAGNGGHGQFTGTHIGGRGGWGGAIYNNTGARLILNSCIFSNNSSGAGGNAYGPPGNEFGGTGGHGGCIYLSAQSSLVMDFCHIDSCTAGNGGYSWPNSTGVRGGEGGGLYVTSGATASIARTTFSRNAAGKGGGCRIGGMGGHGGGISNYGSLGMTNCTLSGNNAGAGGNGDGCGNGGHGGGFYMSNSVTVAHSTIYQNSAGPQGIGNVPGTGGTGGGFYRAGGSPISVSYCILAGNTSYVNIAESQYAPLVGMPNFSSTFIEDGVVHTTPVRLRPLALNGGIPLTHRAETNSPIINTGSLSFSPPPFTDARGRPRVNNGRIDFGAVENDFMEVIGVFPGHRASSISPESDIAVSFNQVVLTNSLLMQHFPVWGSRSGYNAGAIRLEGATVMDPNEAFSAGEFIQSTITDGIISTNDAVLSPRTFEWITSTRRCDAPSYSTSMVSNSTGNSADMAMADLDGDGYIDWCSIPSNAAPQIYLNDKSGNFNFHSTLSTQIFNSVVFGDFNNNGSMDAFAVASSNTGFSAIYTNDGEGNFTLHQLIESEPGRSAAVADMDANGFLDVAVIAQGERTNNAICIYLNGGNLELTPQPAIGNVEYQDLLAADFNGDRYVDIAAVTQFPGATNVIFLNNGYGTWPSSKSLSTQAGKYMSLGDYNLDGIWDMAVANDVGLTVYVSSNNQWTAQSNVAVSGISGIQSGDIDGDNDMDIVISLSDSPGVMFMNNFPAQFSTGILFGSSASDLQMSDIDQDGDLDIAVSETSSLVIHKQHGCFYVTETSPPRAFTAASQDTAIHIVLSDQPSTSSLASANICVYGNLHGNYSGNWTYVSSNTVTFSSAIPFQPGEIISVMISTGVVNEAGGQLSPHIFSFRVQPQGCSSFELTPWQTIGTSSVLSVSAGDMDRDGWMDIVTAGSDGLWLWLSDGGMFTNGIHVFATNSLYLVRLGDMDRDDDLDVYCGGVGGDCILFNQGSGALLPTAKSTFAEVPINAAFGDLNGDGYLEIYTDSNPGRLWWNMGGTNFIPAEISAQGKGVSLVDVDGDGDLDLQKGVLVRFNRGRGDFLPMTSFVGYQLQLDSQMENLDGDLDYDFVLSNGYSLPSTIWKNNGSGWFYQSDQLNVTRERRRLAIEDMDGSGSMDILLTTAFSIQEIWLNNGYGKFSEESLIPAFAYEHAIADLDRDGDLDLIYTDSNPVGITVLRNDHCQGLVIHKESSPTSLEIGNELNYSITVSNKGYGAHQDIVISDILSAELNYRAESSSPECTISNGIVFCRIAFLPQGSSTTLHIRTSVTSTVPGTITNRVEIIASTPAAANSDIESTVITWVPDFDLEGIPDFLDFDDDNDGLSDSYELSHGLSRTNAFDAGEDLDGDGYTALQEYWAYSDHHDSNAFPRVLTIANSGRIEVTFASVTGRIYRLEFTHDLSSDAWTPIFTNQYGEENFTLGIDINIPGTQGYYRYGIELPPHVE